jgi:hypothetical protein
MEPKFLRSILLVSAMLFVSGCATGKSAQVEQAALLQAKLREYCSAPRAYADGEAGRAHRHVCPPELRDEYDTAYRLGRQVYDLNRRLIVIGDTITEKQNRVWRINRDIAALERQQLREDLAPTEIANIKTQSARLQREQDELTSDLDRLRARRAAESDMLTGLKTSHLDL